MKNLKAIFVIAILLFFTSNYLKASQDSSSRGGPISGLFRFMELDFANSAHEGELSQKQNRVANLLYANEETMRVLIKQLADTKKEQEELEQKEQKRKDKKTASKKRAKERKAAAKAEAAKLEAERLAEEKAEAEKVAARLAAEKAKADEAATSSPVSLATIDSRLATIDTRGASPDSVTDSLALAADSEQQSQEELNKRVDNLKVYSPLSSEFCLFSEEKAKIISEKILKPFLEQEENSNLHLVINGGYLVRTYAKQKDIEHFTGDIDFLLVTKDGSEIVFDDLRFRLQLFFYKHQRDLEEETLNYKVESDKTYGIKVAYQEHGGPCIPFMDIGFSKSALEKVKDMGLEPIYDKNLEYDFGVPCTLLSLGNYKIELENRLREYLNSESLLSKKYMHKLSSWMNQLRIIYLLEWDNLGVDQKADFLELYERLQEINLEKIK